MRRLNLPTVQLYNLSCKSTQNLPLQQRVSIDEASNSHEFHCDSAPVEPCTYHIPDTALNVTFTDTELDPTRNESLVSSCITAAIHDTLSKEYFQLIGHDLSYVRESGSSAHHDYHKDSLSIFPEDGMTWGMWTTALIAVNWFVEKYGGWDFSFRVMLVDEQDARRWVRGVGEGYLWTLDEVPNAEDGV